MLQVLMDEGHLDALSSTGKRLLTAGRKMLQDLDPKTGFLDLSGSGVSAGDSTAGVSANAYGHGNFDADNLQDNHVEVGMQLHYTQWGRWQVHVHAFKCAFCC